MMRALIIGCGYLGRRVARIWRSEGHNVAALTRSPENAAVLKALGIEPIVGDVLKPETLRDLPSADVVLYAVGYDRRQSHLHRGSISKRDVYLTGLQNALAELDRRVASRLYISSTSVYGQDRGEWVDEDSDCSPGTEDGEICLAAERIAVGRAIILRFSGIYGPGRLTRRLDSIRNGEPVRNNPGGFLNLIHVDDGARIVAGLAGRATSSKMYLVTDDEPVRRRDYYALLSQLAGGPIPIFKPEVTDETKLNKRCANHRIRQELGDVFRFPTFATGLPHAMAGEP